MTVKFPSVTANLVSGSSLVANTAQKVLIIGQKTVAGTATAGALVENIQNDKSESTLFGPTSMAAELVRNFKAVNSRTQVDVIALDDDGGAASADGVVTFTGTATETAELEIIVGSATNHSYTIAVISGDDFDAVGVKLAAEIAEDANSPVSPANLTGVVTLTAENGGTYGNSLGLYASGEVAGITIALTAFASGASDPTLTGVFDVIGEARYQGIIWPYADDTTEILSFLDARFNVTNDVLDGVGFTAKSDSLANHITALDALNSQSLVRFCPKDEDTPTVKGSALQEIPVAVAAQFAGIRALRLTDGESIGQFVITTNGALDSFGGSALASKPYANTPLSLIPTIPTGLGFTSLQGEQLKTAGGTRVANNRAANGVICDEILTTYKTDFAANPDVTFRFLNSVDTSSGVREFYVNNYRARYAQSRLTDGALLRGRDMVNQAQIEAFSTELYAELSGTDFILTRAGEANLNFFIENLIVTLDLSVGSVSIQMTAPLVSQVRDIEATITVTFATVA